MTQDLVVRYAGTGRPCSQLEARWETLGVGVCARQTHMPTRQAADLGVHISGLALRVRQARNMRGSHETRTSTEASMAPAKTSASFAIVARTQRLCATPRNSH